MKFKNIGIYANPQKDKEFKNALSIARQLRERNLSVYFDKNSLPAGESDIIDYGALDCLFVLGGDGTILKAAQKASRFGIIMLGFNLGRLGFLTETETNKAQHAIELLLAGDFFVERRTMLECCIMENDEQIFCVQALNDASILKKDPARMISIRLIIEGAIADDVACDGILVATPTGSTGYSLSAGGPILSPKLNCLLATPICAHSLHSRSLVVAQDDEIKIVPSAVEGMVLATDGIKRKDIKTGQSILIKKSQNSADFVRFSKDYFYPLLRKKFYQLGHERIKI